MFCKNCGSALPEGTKFCPNCGTARENKVEEVKEEKVEAVAEEVKVEEAAPIVEPVVAPAAGFKLVAVPCVDLVERVQQRIVSVFPKLVVGQRPGIAVRDDIE
jgi:uncharacterized OB-fold protein